MSIIDTAAHNVVKFESGKSKAFEGQRLAVVSYKTVTDKTNPMYGIKRESKCVSVPVISDEEVIGNIEVLIPHIKSFLYSAQDKIVRELLDTDGKRAFVTQEEISLAAIVEYLDNSSESGRLTKETVAKWFDESIADSLMLVLAEKLGVSDIPTEAQTKQVDIIVTGFKDKISSLAGGKTSYEPKLCESLIKCLKLAPADDVLASRFEVRLNKMIADSRNAVSLYDAL